MCRTDEVSWFKLISWPLTVTSWQSTKHQLGQRSVQCSMQCSWLINTEGQDQKAGCPNTVNSDIWLHRLWHVRHYTFGNELTINSEPSWAMGLNYFPPISNMQKTFESTWSRLQPLERSKSQPLMSRLQAKYKSNTVRTRQAWVCQEVAVLNSRRTSH